MRNLKALFLLFFFTSTLKIATATEAVTWDYIERQQFTEVQRSKDLTVKWFMILYFNEIGEWIPESYKDIALKFYNVDPNTPIYDALQRWVYLWLIKNRPISLGLSEYMTESVFNRFIKENFELVFDYKANTNLKLGLFLDIMAELKTESGWDTSSWTPQKSTKYELEDVSNFPILNDVYLKLKNQHYDSSEFTDENLIRWAIKWMVDSTWDKYTVYFPPVESKNFQDELSWEFEWIWAHIEMQKPWELNIVSPIQWSPAEKAWLKSSDRIMKIDWVDVTEKTTLQEAVSKIKWPAWTEVTLTILRWTDTLEIKVKRDRITISYVDYKKLTNWDNYISITTFWAWAANTFSWVVDTIRQENPYAKTILDLRNNPGWSLDEVAKMLQFFVPKWSAVVNIRYKNYSSDILAQDDVQYSFTNKKVIILVNNWSASASEIMAWTIKDYLWSNVKIVWETSYWKWSVQSLDDYSDGSSIKYTIAKWFTWKTKTWIDWVGIKPDIYIKFDEGQAKNWVDNQLNFAKDYRF